MSKMNRREFSKLMLAAVGGLMAAPAVLGCSSSSTKPAADSGAMTASDKHACKGLNECKGKGGCSAGDNGCASKNSCKGKGGCATAAKHECKGMNACKGQGGCKSGDNGCAGKNTCKGKGGCAVPVSMK